MGCVNVKLQQQKFSKVGQKPYEAANKPPVLTDSQKAVLRNNWQVLKLHVVNVGVITFVGMFETRPDLKDVFAGFRGKDLQELKNSGLIRAHALRVMATVDKCLARLDENSNFVKFLRELGAQHRTYEVTFNQIQSISTPFICAIRNHIEDHWSDDVEEAWLTLLNIMFFHMKEGIDTQNQLIAKKEQAAEETIT